MQILTNNDRKLHYIYSITDLFHVRYDILEEKKLIGEDETNFYSNISDMFYDSKSFKKKINNYYSLHMEKPTHMKSDSVQQKIL